MRSWWFVTFALAMTSQMVGAQKTSELSPSDLFAKNRASVVLVETPSGFGSGVIIGDNGLVVTNLHVIADDVSAMVKLADGDRYDNVTVAALDERRDLALLRIAGFGLKPARLANSEDLRVGDRVYAIGTPKGLELSLSEGLVSSLRSSGDGYQVIQTTAPISSGSSGGGLFNAQGELVGITSFKIAGGENLNFAVPVNYVRGLMEIADGAMSLELVNRVYGKRERSQPSSRTATPGSESGSSVVSKPTAPLFPRLATAYSSTRSGGRLLVSQEADTARVAIYNAASQQVGNAVVRWDSVAVAFVGKAEVRFVCGVYDTRTTTVTSDISYSPQAGGLILERYSRPAGLNCSRGQVKGFIPAEDQWWPAP